MNAAHGPALVASAVAALVICIAIAMRSRGTSRSMDRHSVASSADGAGPRDPRARLRGRKQRRAAATLRDTAVHALERTARELRAGSSLAAALADGLDAHPLLLGGLGDDLRRGHGARHALDHARAGATADERLVLQALRVALSAGRAAPEVLERAAAVLRERAAWERERHGQTAQARLSARVLTALPIVFAVWSVLADDGVRQAYRTSALPALSAALGAVLNVTGWWWMRRMTERAA